MTAAKQTYGIDNERWERNDVALTATDNPMIGLLRNMISGLLPTVATVGNIKNSFFTPTRAAAPTLGDSFGPHFGPQR